MLTVGDTFPEYVCQACTGLDQDGLTQISSEQFKGKWQVYLFYPKDFTFVCPTELVEFGKSLSEFEDRDCAVLGGSTDNEFSHQAWRKAHDDLRDLPYPLLGAQKLSAALGILDPEEGVCLRATFIVDPHGTIQWVQANNLNVGRSVHEALRILDAIQSDELCPCNWEPGQKFL